MKLLPIQNTRTNGVSVSAQSNTQNNTHPLQSKMQIRTGYLTMLHRKTQLRHSDGLF